MADSLFQVSENLAYVSLIQRNLENPQNWWNFFLKSFLCLHHISQNSFINKSQKNTENKSEISKKATIIFSFLNISLQLHSSTVHEKVFRCEKNEMDYLLKIEMIYDLISRSWVRLVMIKIKIIITMKIIASAVENSNLASCLLCECQSLSLLVNFRVKEKKIFFCVNRLVSAIQEDVNFLAQPFKRDSFCIQAQRRKKKSPRK